MLQNQKIGRELDPLGILREESWAYGALTAQRAYISNSASELIATTAIKNGITISNTNWCK